MWTHELQLQIDKRLELVILYVWYIKKSVNRDFIMCQMAKRITFNKKCHTSWKLMSLKDSVLLNMIVFLLFFNVEEWHAKRNFGVKICHVTNSKVSYSLIYILHFSFHPLVYMMLYFYFKQVHGSWIMDSWSPCLMQ